MSNAAKLLNRIMDKTDKILFMNGLIFREDKDWEEAASEMAAWVYRYYEDEGSEDNSYQPGDSAESELLTEESETRTLDTSSSPQDTPTVSSSSADDENPVSQKKQKNE